NPELKVYLSNAPTHTPVAALVRVAGMRWPIETAFEESKGGLGLDHYEVRSWLGWHHHMTLCLLAHHFLVLARHRVKNGRRGVPSGSPCCPSPPGCPRSRSRPKRRWSGSGISSSTTMRHICRIAGASWSV